MKNIYISKHSWRDIVASSKVSTRSYTEVTFEFSFPIILTIYFYICIEKILALKTYSNWIEMIDSQCVRVKYNKEKKINDTKGMFHFESKKFYLFLISRHIINETKKYLKQFF